MLIRKTIIAAKIESTYNVDAVPTAPLNAIRCRNLRIEPLKVEKEKRETYQGFLGNTEDIPVMEEVTVDFEVEFAGSGVAATPPKYGPLLRSCAHSETVTAADVTGTAQAGAASTITLNAGASAVDGVFIGMVIDTTGGTGSGQSRVVVDYVGATKIATVDRAWTVNPDATTVFAIRANVQYRPISTGFESVDIYVWRDGILYKSTGMRGKSAKSTNAKKIPIYKFSYIGLFAPVTDVTLPTNADFSGFQTPRASIPLWVPSASIFGYAAKMANLDIDGAQDVQHMVWMNSESVDMVDRLPTGKATVEAVLVGTKDYWTAMRNVTKGAIAMRHGTASGNSIVVCAPAAQLNSIGDGEVNKVNAFNLDFTFNPLRGNDDYTITCM